MRKSRFTEEQIIGLKEAESGRRVTDPCRKHGIGEPTFYRWKSKYSGVEVSDARKLRRLEDENRRLNQLVVDQQLDRSQPGGTNADDSARRQLRRSAPGR